MKRLSIDRVLILGAGGMLGGLVTFALLNPAQLAHEARGAAGISSPAAALRTVISAALILGVSLGASVGAGITLGEELRAGAPVRALRRLPIAIGVGALCGAFGGITGQVLFSLIIGVLATSGVPQMAAVVIGRTLGWSLVGAAAGACPGAASGSLSRAGYGVLGGLLGGAAGGVLFDLLGSASHNGSLSRLVGFLLIGGLVGALAALVEEAARRYWISHLTGAREGRATNLVSAISVIGRDELAAIPLFGDPTVQKVHAQIELGPAGATLRAFGPLTLNGAPVTVAPLHDGDLIQIGRARLRCGARAGGPAPLASGASRDIRPAPGPVQPLPPGPALPAPAAAHDYPTAPAPAPLGPAAAAPTLVAGGATALRIIEGPHAGLVCPIIDGSVVGRDPSASIPLAGDAQVSRRHARFACQAGVWSVQDLGSTNGVWLNGLRTPGAPLRQGDRIAVGATVMVFEQPAAGGVL